MSSYGHDQQTNPKRQYSLSKDDSALCEAKAICGMTSPRVTVLSLFYEWVNRLMETKEIKKKHDSKNKLDKRIKTTNPPKIESDAICAQDTWKFNSMLDFSIFMTSKGNFPYRVLNTFVYRINSHMSSLRGLWINNKHHDIFNTILRGLHGLQSAWSSFWKTPFFICYNHPLVFY